MTTSYFPQPNQSLPLAYNINASNKTIPTIWAYSKNLSLGLRRVIISYKVNITCPPSRAGIGRRFINARTIERKAVMVQNASQSQPYFGKIEPIALNPPNPLYPPVFGLRIFLN